MCRGSGILQVLSECAVMRKICRPLLAYLVPIALLLAVATAQSPSPSPAPAPTGPTGPAKVLLDKMLKAYVDFKSGVISTDVKVVDAEFAGTQKTEMRIVRPKKLYWHGEFRPASATLQGFDVYIATDGKEITVFDSKNPRLYRQGKLPDPIRAIDLADYWAMGLSTVFLHAMTGESNKVWAGRKIELKPGTDNVLLVFSEDSVDEYTLDPATSRIAKVVNTVGDKVMAEGTISYSREGESLPDSDFAFTPPAGAERKDIEADE